MQKHEAHAEPKVTGTGFDLEGTPFYVVPSRSELSRSHILKQSPTRLACDCKDYFYRQRRCKHIAAVIEHRCGQRFALVRTLMNETMATLRRVNAELDAMDRRDKSGIAASHKTPERWRCRSQRPFSLLA
jgi:predicted nucleic acid-binding Zn ribbon protein